MTDSIWFRRAFFAAGTGNGVTSNYLFAQWADQQMRMNTSLDSNLIFRYIGSPIPEDTFIPALNDGVSLVVWRSSYIDQIPSPLLEWICGPRQPIGVFSSCMTDGFAEQFGGPNEIKSQQRQFVEMLLENFDTPMNNHENLLRKTILDWQGNNEQVDDMLVIGFSI